MKVLKKLATRTRSKSVITIGNFDGVHLGHRQVLEKVTNIASKTNEEAIVITFENHPNEVLRPETTVPLICSVQHRLKLLEQLGCSTVYLLRFDHALANQSATQFLSMLQSELHFSHLILGHDATIGKAREGNQQKVQSIAQQLQFEVQYMPPYLSQGERISSSAIRKAIQEGNFERTKEFLGRPYSIYALVSPGKMHGKKIGFPTINLDVENLCLPPLGVYVVEAKLGTKRLQGVANLGIAPTMRHDQKVILEVHLFNWQEELYGQMVEVQFHSFIRPEKKFSSVDELVVQIQQDIQEAKHRLTTVQC